MQGVKRTKTAVMSAEKAFQGGDEAEFIRAVLAKYAHIIDECDSARDMKPLATGAFEAWDRLKALEASGAAEDEAAETPLASVLRMAQ